MKHYQASFTRLGWQGVGDGWQALNTSPELSSEVVSSFTRFQNSNVYEPAFDNEDSSAKTVLELQTDSKNVFLTYIKYGLQDQMGRPAMFANSFIFDINEFVADPGGVLRVKKDNFSFDMESTKQERSSLSMADPFFLTGSMDRLRFDAGKYALLVQCVYSVLDAKTKSTLHIVCDCSEDTIRNIMFCIYSALSFAFRKNVSFSSYEVPGSAQKTIVFDRDIKGGNVNYFVAQTGENNVITEAVSKRWERYEFMTYIPRNPSEDPAAYFTGMEDILSRFGNAQSTALDLNKVAFDIWLYERNPRYLSDLTEDAVCKRLNELLSITVSRYSYLDEQISYALGEIVERDIILNDIISEKLCQRLEKTEDENLIEVGNIYNANKIKRMAVEEGANYLYSSYSDRSSNSFLQIRKVLAQDEAGREILRYLYIDLIAQKLPLEEEHILKYYEETRRLPMKTVIQNKIGVLCYECLKKRIEENTSPWEFTKMVYALAESVLSDNSDLYTGCVVKLKENYWEKITLDSLDFEKTDSYECVKDDASPRSRLAFKCFEIWNLLKQGDTEKFCNHLHNLLNRRSRLYQHNAANEIVVSAADRDVLMKKFTRECLARKSIYGISGLDMWLFLAELNGTNPVQFLIHNDILTAISVVSSDLESAVEESTYLGDPSDNIHFTGQLKEYIRDKSEGYDIAAELLKRLNEFEKRERRRRAEDEKASRKENSEGGVFSAGASAVKNIFSFGRKKDKD